MFDIIVDQAFSVLMVAVYNGLAGLEISYNKTPSECAQTANVFSYRSNADFPLEVYGKTSIDGWKSCAKAVIEEMLNNKIISFLSSKHSVC